MGGRKRESEEGTNPVREKRVTDGEGGSTRVRNGIPLEKEESEFSAGPKEDLKSKMV